MTGLKTWLQKFCYIKSVIQSLFLKTKQTLSEEPYNKLLDMTSETLDM